MRKHFFQLFLFFFILGTVSAYAGLNSFTTSYPAPQASYTKIMLVNQSNATGICGTPAAPTNNGALFVDPSSGLLKTCVNGNMVSSLQGCFNQFCSDTSGSNAAAPNPNCSTTLPLNCPGGYTSASEVDTFLTGSTNGGPNYYWTTSIICCPTAAYNAAS